MILDEITLQNFGLYAGTQTIDLTPPAPDKPIILLGGLNGGGKTTFLDALQLCLFGAHAKVSNRGTMPYREYLSRSIHSSADVPEAAIKISFRRTVEGQEEHYSLRRSWKRANGACREQFDIQRNGAPAPVLADNWASQVEEFFPANIAHLFLFDGEQIAAYASEEESSALIGSAIQNLLGLDMVDQLARDLLVYERRKRSEKYDDSIQEQITILQGSLSRSRQRIDSLKQERAALRTHRIDKQERELLKADEQYRKLGGTLYDRRESIERSWTDARQRVREGEAFLREFAAGPAPLLLVRVLLASTEARDQQEEQCRRARYLAEALNRRDRATLKHLRSRSVDASAIDAVKKFLRSDRAARRELGKTTTVLDILPEVRSDLHAALRGGLDTLAAEARRLLDLQNKRNAQSNQAQTEYESIPSSDTIAEVTESIRRLKEELSELEVTDEALRREIEREEREFTRQQQSLTRLLEVDAREREHRDDRERILYHAAKVRSTLGSFRRAVVECHVRRIEQLVLESYQQLLRKSALVTQLSISPIDFSLTLLGRDREELSAERLSAGERQLLAIALLWGLAKASGRPLPTAIDTPLGRLDSVHRMHLVERYLPFASHQVLLLSTDEEIAGEYLDRLAPWIGRTYQLAYSDEIGETRIVEGYLDTGGTA